MGIFMCIKEKEQNEDLKMYNKYFHILYTILVPDVAYLTIFFKKAVIRYKIPNSCIIAQMFSLNQEII